MLRINLLFVFFLILYSCFYSLEILDFFTKNLAHEKVGEA